MFRCAGRVLGIDISKKVFDAALLQENKVKTKKFTNDQKGFASLIAWLTGLQIDLSDSALAIITLMFADRPACSGDIVSDCYRLRID